MVGPSEPNNLEGEGFPSEVGRSPEADGHIDLTERGGAMSRHDIVEWRCVGSQPRPIDPHEVESLGVQDVEATTSVHQDFSESGIANDRVDDKWVVSRVRDVLRVVISAKRDGFLGPIEE
jgi:hypothetical protein